MKGCVNLLMIKPDNTSPVDQNVSSLIDGFSVSKCIVPKTICKVSPLDFEAIENEINLEVTCRVFGLHH